MKKSIIIFVSFCLVFALSLGIIYYKANPTISLPTAQSLEWRGHVECAQGTYNGSLLDGFFNGQGDFSFVTGEFYTGEWTDSYMSGDGKVVFPGVGTYTGNMVESKRSGNGTFIWSSGDEYAGNWENDAMSGEGCYTFENGCVFNGVFQNNKPISGTLTYSVVEKENMAETDIISLTINYESGRNTIMFTTKGGLVYDGDVSGLYSTGYASIIYPSGNTYEGSLSEGKRNGDGKYTWKDENGKVLSFYSGKWEDDHMNGKGQYHYSATEYPYLDGNFVNDVPDGVLTYYKAAGNTFETTWSNGYCINIKET